MALSSRPWRPARTACPRPDRCAPPPPALLRSAAVTSSGGLRPFSGRIRSLATAAPASASMAALPSTSAVAAGSRLSVAVMSRIRARVDTSAGLTTCPALLLVPFLRSVRLACRHRTSSHPVRFPDVLTPLCTSSRVRRCPVGATPLCPLRLRLPPFLLHPPRHALGSGRHQMRPLSSPGSIAAPAVPHRHFIRHMKLPCQCFFLPCHRFTILLSGDLACIMWNLYMPPMSGTAAMRGFVFKKMMHW